MVKDKVVLGWREWFELPTLGIPAIKVKVDTGARTSALHAFKIKPFKKHGKKFVKFQIHPVQKRKDIVRTCIAEVVDRRYIKDSGGHRELRYIIKTLLKIRDLEWEAEVSLTDRRKMNFRMLLGRTAMKNIITNPRKSFIKGDMDDFELVEMYQDQNSGYEI